MTIVLGGKNPFNWRRLLSQIRRGEVVPIVGPELLPYHLSLAPALADALGVSSDMVGHGIGAVADEHVSHHGDERKASEELERLLETFDEPVKALRQLVSIREFRLFVTTDYASLIERELARRSEPYRTLGFALNRRFDDIDGYPKSERYVYHLLGHYRRYGTAALARVDQLEYVYGLQSEAGPTELLDVLRERGNLLFLGCDLPEWLAGFFTRTLLGKPLYDTRERGIEVVASRSAFVAGLPSPLTAFLRDNRVEVFDGDAETFVAELVNQYETTEAPRSVATPAAAPSGSGSTKGHAFISYCRHDMERVRKLIGGLRARSIEVWFDESNIRPGDSFDDSIRLAIEDDAASFVAVLSRAAFERDRSYFIQEWESASTALSRRWKNVRFVFPVIIDDMDRDEASRKLRECFPAFAGLHIESCPNAESPPPQFIDALREARKNYERRVRR